MENDDGDRTAILGQLNRELSQFPGIVFAVLYGSAAEGDDFQDLDVGVMVDREVISLSDAPLYEFEVERALSRSVPYAVDVRLLNDAPLPFLYNVSKGVPILLREAEAWYRFKEHTWDMWLDFQPVAMRYLRELAGG